MLLQPQEPLPVRGFATASARYRANEAGYGSNSGRYGGGGRALGLSPSQPRRGTSQLDISAVVRRCSLGQMLVAATARGVCAVIFGDGGAALMTELLRRFPGARVRPGGKGRQIEGLAERVVDLVEAVPADADIPLDLIGTAFQQRVWRALRDIPRGQTATYAEIARRIGAPRAVRAVGTACGANPVAVAVPCHRVVRGDGTLGGYRWGLDRKKALLARERALRGRFDRRHLREGGRSDQRSWLSFEMCGMRGTSTE